MKKALFLRKTLWVLILTLILLINFTFLNSVPLQYISSEESNIPGYKKFRLGMSKDQILSLLSEEGFTIKRNWTSDYTYDNYTDIETDENNGFWYSFTIETDGNRCYHMSASMDSPSPETLRLSIVNALTKKYGRYTTEDDSYGYGKIFVWNYLPWGNKYRYKISVPNFMRVTIHFSDNYLENYRAIQREKERAEATRGQARDIERNF